MVRRMGEPAKGYFQIKYGAISLGYIDDYPTWDEIREYCHLHFIYHVHETKTALRLSIVGILVAIHGRQDRITSDHVKKVARKDIGYTSPEIVNSRSIWDLCMEIQGICQNFSAFHSTIYANFHSQHSGFPSAYFLLFSISSLRLLRPSYVYKKQRDHRHPQDGVHVRRLIRPRYQ